MKNYPQAAKLSTSPAERYWLRVMSTLNEYQARLFVAERAAKRILICADSGGGNGHRQRAWKVHLQRLSNETGLAVTVCHYPPGTSKWNKIEHRLFSFISLNWKGKPLINFETVVNLIGGTRTKTGLKVKAILDTNQYETGVELSKKDLDQLCLTHHKIHPDWNYTLSPRPVN